SFRGTFAWATSPLLLLLAKRDLGEKNLKIPSLDGRCARSTPENACVYNNRLYLEDLDLPARDSSEIAVWAERLAPLVSPEDHAIFTERCVLVGDETMTFLWETATQVDARIRLDETTRTVASGALWLEESLPPETLLIGLFAADRSRRSNVDMTPDD